MKENVLNAWKQNLDLALELTRVNADAAEQMMTRQVALAGELLKVNLAHGKTLVDCKTVQGAVEVNRAWGQDVQKAVATASEANIELIDATRSRAGEIMETLAKRATEQVEEGVAEMRSKVEASVEEAKASVDASMKAAKTQVEKAVKKAA